MRFDFPWAILLVSSLACSSQKEAASIDTSKAIEASAQPATPPSPPSKASSACPHDGKWALCSIETRLKQSGFVVKRVEDTTHRAGFSVKPVVYTLGKSRLEIFLYR